MRRFIISLVAALALSTPALAQGTTTINNLPAANTPLYCSEVVASWQVYRTVKIPVALAGAVCQAATAPLSPFAGQQWWDTSAGAGLWSLRVYDGASWLPIGRLDTTAHVWTPATNQPVQTVTGASKTFTASDFQFDTRRSNSASAMTDTFPALAAGVNGARITVTNADASAGDTITAASGTTICGANSCGTTTVVPAGRSLAFVFDSANTAWRPSANTATAVLGPTSTASGNLAAFTDTTGKALTDSGVLPANVVQGPGSATSGNLASYNGTSGKLLADASVAVNQVVTLTGSQILTNKTLTAPVIGTIVNTGTLTLPTSTDTIVGRATTDTLTNKTLTAPVMTTPTLGVASATSLGLSGNVSGSAIFGTAGIKFKNAAATLSDTTSTGTITANYNNLFGGNTQSATAATTITNNYGSYFSAPTCSTNVTCTNNFALGADSLKIAGSGGASASPLQVTGTWYVAGTSTTNYPAAFITATGASIANLNTNGSGLVVNAPSGFSAGGSLLELFANGVSKHFFGANGDMVIQGGLTVQGAGGVFGGNAGQINGTTGLVLANTKGMTFSATSGSNGSPDAGFYRDSVLGAGNVDLGNGTANDKSGTLNLAAIKITGTMTGGSGITLVSGNFTFGGNDQLYWTNKSRISGGATDGIVTLLNNAQTDFSRLQFGGTTSSFPSIKRNSTALNFRLADDSADAPITAAAATLSGTLTTNVTGGGTQCAQVSNTGVLSGTGTACAAAVTVPTIQKFLTGSGTYTTPAGVRQLRVRMWAGGGGGGGWNGTNNAGTGGTTSFGSTTVIGGGPGGPGNPSPGNGGIGGTGGSDTGATSPISIDGQQGQSGLWNAGGVGQGASSFGGGSYGGAGSNGNAPLGYGGGGTGAGAFAASASGSATSGGGGAGGGGQYKEFLVNSPGATISYVVGAGGVASSAASINGSAGVGGAIFIEERY